MFIDHKAMTDGQKRLRRGEAASMDISRPYARFVQPDPIGYEDGLNIYAYVGADPVNSVDPLGLACERDPAVSATVCAIMPDSGGISGATGTMGSTARVNEDEDLMENLVCRTNPENCGVVRGKRPRRVAQTLYKGNPFTCRFLGGSQFTISVRNLQPFLDGLRINASSFNTIRGNVVPVLSNPGYGTVQGGHLLPGRMTHFDFQGPGVPDGNPYFHVVHLPYRARAQGATNTGSLMNVDITTNGDTTGCL